MNVLILGRTKMSGSFRCIGGISIENGRAVRLISQQGRWDTSAPFQIGQIWEISASPVANIYNPHTEDIIVNGQRLVSTCKNLAHEIRKSNILHGGIDLLFNKNIKFTNSGSGYIDNTSLTFSTTFWKPDQNLTLRATGTHYDYPGHFQTKGLKYVGEPAPVSVIPAGIPVRVSLARWWSPDSSTTPYRCYAQLSGWF